MTTLLGGTVTFAFTDVEGSTKLLRELGDADYARAASDHRRLLREAFVAHGGNEVDTQGDAFFFAFVRARDAVAAAVEAQRALRAHAWPRGSELRVRMGLHTGEAQIGEEGYLGLDVVRAARIGNAGHGGQILVSETTRALLGSRLPEGTTVEDLGRVQLKDVPEERVYDVVVDGVRASRPLKVERQGDLGDRLAARIEAHVEQHLERALSGGDTTVAILPSAKLASLGLTGLVILAALVVGIVLLVKLAL
jgi:class 3 adenylate cyclase